MSYDPLALLCRAHGLPEPETEVCFAPPRKWRFDYAWNYAFVALEVEGGAWTGGRHTRGKGFENDCRKYNAANLVGWTVFRATPEMVRSGEVLTWLTPALGTCTSGK